MRLHDVRSALSSAFHRDGVVVAMQVRMGFGLHVGWAIEGAIGSEYKIDASYLSPNVNMASRLEAATKQFGTTILLSDHFVALLSPNVRRRVRQVRLKPFFVLNFDCLFSGTIPGPTILG